MIDEEKFKKIKKKLTLSLHLQNTQVGQNTASGIIFGIWTEKASLEIKI